MRNLRFKSVFRFDEGQRHLRLFRIMWEVGAVGDGQGYSAKLSLAICPKLFRFNRGFHETDVTILGMRLHFAKSYGGIYV